MLKGVLISSIDQMPLTDERIGTNEKFIQIGCDGCPNKVCLIASGIAVADAVSKGSGFAETDSQLRVMYESIADIDKG